MPVTNAVFNFQGTDVTTTTNLKGAGAQTGSVTEHGITFSFTSQPGTSFSGFNNSGIPLSVSSGTVTLTINDTPNEEFFSNRDWPVASAVAVVLLLILVIPIILFQKNQERQAEAEK